MSMTYMRVIKDMYDGARTKVKTSVGDIEDLFINIGLH